ncbi:MAG: hypothetical protein OEY14_05205, partial [Myxococcales bacterium]|nr:hypothetical protein [Myxococcales bacterium]
MSQRLLPAALALFAALGFPACGEEPDEATASGAEAPPTSGPRSAPRAAEGDAPEPEGVARIRYDLARHLARAEMRERGALWIDFGVPGGAKYTLGGWRTRAGPDRDFDGTSALVFRGVTGKLLLPADSEGAHVLLLRARAFGDGRLTVYIEGETVAHARLPTDGRFETIRIELPAGRLRRGENMLQLRVPRAGAAPGLRAAGLALDWLRLQPLGPELPPAPIPSEVSSPPAPSALLTSSRGIATLSLPAGLSLGYGLVVPPGARLRARLEGESGSLVVRAHRDGAPPLLLHEAEPGPEGAAIDLSLEALAGSFARIDLESTGALRLLEPAIVTLEPVSVTIPSPLAGSAPTPPRNVLIF